jgi:hypothetical protein
MDRVKFNESELTPVGVYKGRFDVSYTKLSTPVSTRENLLALYRRERPLWFPHNYEQRNELCPVILPDNVARAFVLEKTKLTTADYGGKDMFGVTWFYEEQAGGSMVIPGNPLVKDLTRWEDYVKFPDVDSWDWAGNSALNKDLFGDDMAVNTTIFNGLFERLISFLDFGDAAIALIDDEMKEHVHRLLSRVCDVYEKIIDNLVKYYRIDFLTFHDDWGAQRAPFFAPEVCQEMLVPHLKRIVDHTHKRGVFFNFHSCGFNEQLVPQMISAGVDSWAPQPHNNLQSIYDKYGDKVIITMVPESVPTELSDAEIAQRAQEYVARYIGDYDRKPFIVGVSVMDPTGKLVIDPRFATALYQASRKALNP